MSVVASIEQLPPGWETAQVTFAQNGQLKTRLQIIDRRADPPLQYRHDAMREIALKCALIVLALIVVLPINLAFHFVRTLVLVVHTIVRSASWTQEVPSILARGVRDFLKAPVCAAGMGLAASVGIVCERLEMRALVGKIERIWRGASRSHDMSRFKRDRMGFLVDLLTNPYSENCWYLAYCFQPIGPISAKHVQKVEPIDPQTTKQIVLTSSKS